MAGPAIFLDRDGVLNENLPDHVRSWEEFRFIPGALKALRALTRFDVPILVVTNQAAINRRLVTQDRVDEIHRRMVEQARQAGARITAVFCCPHRPDEACDCRKPAPGLLVDAAARYDIDLSRSVLVGDAWSDIQAGQRASCQTVLVLTGRGRGALSVLDAIGARRPTAVAADLLSAVPIVSGLLRNGAPLPPAEVMPSHHAGPLPASGYASGKG